MKRKDPYSQAPGRPPDTLLGVEALPHHLSSSSSSSSGSASPISYAYIDPSTISLADATQNYQLHQQQYAEARRRHPPPPSPSPSGDQCHHHHHQLQPQCQSQSYHHHKTQRFQEHVSVDVHPLPHVGASLSLWKRCQQQRCYTATLFAILLVFNFLVTGYIFFTYVSVTAHHEMHMTAVEESLEESVPLVTISEELERGVMIDPVARVRRLGGSGVGGGGGSSSLEHDHVYQTVKYDFYLGTKANVWERYPGGVSRSGLSDVRLHEGLFFTMCCHTKAYEMLCSGGTGNTLMAKIEKDGDRAFLSAMFSDSALAGSACTFTFTMDRMERQF